MKTKRGSASQREKMVPADAPGNSASWPTPTSSPCLGFSPPNVAGLTMTLGKSDRGKDMRSPHPSCGGPAPADNAEWPSGEVVSLGKTIWQLQVIHFLR